MNASSFHSSLMANVTAALLLFCPSLSRAQFTPGNLVVLQVGDGVGSFTNTGNPIVLKEFSGTGTPGFSLSVPSAGTSALVISGSATSEGILSNSSDKRLLVFGGYNQALPNSVSLSSSASSVLPRGVGAVDAAGGYSLAAASSSFYSGNNMRCATSNGGNNYWGGGGVDGTDYFGGASAAANVQNVKVNTRAVAIFGNQLYFSTQSGSGAQPNLGLYAVGTGTPATSGQTIANIINTGTGSQPVQFFFQPGLTPTVCYVADSRSGTGGGVQKWVYASSTWSLAYTIPTSSSSAGANGVVADFTGPNPMVYATTVEGTNNRLVSILDNGSGATATTIATSTTNTIFRGLAFSPCLTPSISLVASNGPICAGQSLSLSAAASGGTLTSYAWYGNGTFSSFTSPSVSVTGASTGVYTLEAINACGSSFSTVNVTVNPLPAVSINASTTSICPGQSLTLSGNGANSYTWSSGVVNNQPFTTPSSGVYTLTGTSAGCSANATIAITVNTLSVLAPAITICSGQSGTLVASGAATYTWNSGANTTSLVVNPSATTTYTIAGTSSVGCVATSTTQVAVTTSPAISVNSATVCAGKSATLAASGVNTYSWSNGASSSSIVVTPSISTTYSLTGTLAGCPGSATGFSSVQVNPLPLLSISGSSFVCAGGSATLTVSGASTYTWSSLSTASSIVVTPTASGSYSVSGTSVSGCVSGTSASVVLLALPIVSITAASSTVCVGTALSFTANGASTYSWSNSASGAVISVSPSVSSSYTVTGTDVNGCKNTAVKSISVLAAPVLSVATSASLICSGETISVTVGGAVTYSWSNGSTATLITVTPSASPVYTLTVTGMNSNSCVATSLLTQSVLACAGLEQMHSADEAIKLIPNPAVSDLRIELNQGNPVTLELISAMGETVLILQNYFSNELIDLSRITKGIYNVRILSGHGFDVKKLIIR